MHDSIIIGAGIIGLMSARELARAGHRVLLLERGRCGHQASWAGGGILSPLYPWKYPQSVNRLASLSAAAYENLADRLLDAGHVDPELLHSGMVILDPEEFQPALAWAGANDVCARVLTSDALAEHAPHLAPTPGGALLLPNVGQVRNPRLLRALRDDIHVLGVEVREHTPVRAVRHRNQRVTGVNTDTGPLPAGQVVLAAGCWTSGLAPGLEGAVRAVKGQMLLFEAAPKLLRTIVINQGRYLISRRDGRILVGSTTEERGFDVTPTVDAAESLRSWATENLPPLTRLPIAMHWAGLRPATTDEIPLIGEHPDIKGLFLNTGHYRNGLCTAPASARLLADLMLTRHPLIDPTPYRPGRLKQQRR